jgi:Dolichyl-phosphate-mannose-protein mannosyltransferase
MKTLPDSVPPRATRSAVARSQTENFDSPELCRLEPSRPLWRQLDGFIGLVMLGTIAYLYLSLFVLPNTPILQADDQVFFWMNAQRMLHGDRAYVDFFQYTPPGTDLFFLLLFKLFGARIWVLNAAVLALGAALCWVCFRVANQIMKRPLALLATVVYLILIFSKLLNATHHWFSILMVMCATSVIIRTRTARRVAIAGGALGLAAFFTQTHGVAAVAALAIFLIWEQYRAQRSLRDILTPPVMLSVSFAGAVLGLNAYFIASVGLNHLWYEQVTYVRRFGLQGFQNLGLPALLTWHSLPTVGQQVFVYLLLPIIYLLSLLRFWIGSSDPRSDDDRRTALLSLVGLFLLAEVALSPNWLRIYAVSMPGIILAIWILGRMGKVRRYAILLIWAGIASLALTQTWRRHHQPYAVVELPGGTAAVPAPKWEELHWIMQHTKPGDFFFQADWPGMYVPLELRNPVFLDAVGANEQTRPEYVDLTIRQLEERKVRYVLWSRRLDNSNVNRPWEYHLEPLKNYLRDQYSRVKTFADQDEVWERK